MVVPPTFNSASRCRRRWQPEFEVAAQQEGMRAIVWSSLSGAAVLMATLADQTSLPWPDEFPARSVRTWHGGLGGPSSNKTACGLTRISKEQYC